MTAQRLETKPVLDKATVLHRAGMELDDATDLPWRARTFVRTLLEGWSVSDDCIDAVLLLTTEVITNALRHGAPPLHLAITHGTFGLNVDVSDSSLLPPEVGRPDFDSEGGRGLWLVQTLATTWGHTVSADRKSVWFTLASPPRRHPPQAN